MIIDSNNVKDFTLCMTCKDGVITQTLEGRPDDLAAAAIKLIGAICAKAEGIPEDMARTAGTIAEVIMRNRYQLTAYAAAEQEADNNVAGG